MKMLNYSTIKVEQVQTQNSEIKNRGVGVKHHGVCVECSKQAQNSATKPKLRNKKFWGGRKASWRVCVCVCVECSKQAQNSKKKKSWGRRKASSCVCVCVWNVRNIPITRQQTQNSETKIVGWA